MQNSSSSSRPWGRLRGEEVEDEYDEYDDAFAMAPSTNVSMISLHGDGDGRGSPEIKRNWNPYYAASGESLDWQHPPSSPHHQQHRSSHTNILSPSSATASSNPRPISPLPTLPREYDANNSSTTTLTTVDSTRQ